MSHLRDGGTLNDFLADIWSQAIAVRNLRLERGMASSSRCPHRRQSPNGSNQYQSMVKCLDCNKVLAQVYFGCDFQQLRRTQVMRQLLESEHDALREELRLVQQERAALRRLVAQLQRQVETARTNTVVPTRPVVAPSAAAAAQTRPARPGATPEPEEEAPPVPSGPPRVRRPA